MLNPITHRYSSDDNFSQWNGINKQTKPNRTTEVIEQDFIGVDT